MFTNLQAMRTYLRMHTGQRLEEEHRHMEVDHAWSTELLKFAHELLFQRDYSGSLDRRRPYCAHSVLGQSSKPD